MSLTRIDMNNFKSQIGKRFLFLLISLMVLGPLVTRAQQSFSSPEEAVNALKAAIKSKDQGSIVGIFGPRVRDMVSGDSTADSNELDAFSTSLSKSSKLEKESDTRYILLVGDAEYPFVAPIIKSGDKWRFDTNAGVEELIDRRIGSNEIDAIAICQAYVLAQYDYFNGDDQDADQVSEYAQRIASSPGKRDGLYWEKSSD